MVKEKNTIQFNCPKCEELIAFDGKFCGKRASCYNCGQKFIIPSRDYETPEITTECEEVYEPVPGFYRAVFVDSWKTFFKLGNIAGLVFVAAAVCFKFFAGHLDYSFTMGAFRLQANMGFVISLVAWGCMFWYYMEIINLTAIGEDEMEYIEIGGFFGLLWNVIKSLFLFGYTLILSQVPCIIFLNIEHHYGFQMPVIRWFLSIAGITIFPSGILILSILGGIEHLYMPNYILKPILKAALPYVTIVILFIITWQLQIMTIEYGQIKNPNIINTALHLSANLAVQGLTIISMRTLGMFYRHFYCYYPF